MDREISLLRELSWDDMTQQERVKLLLADSDAYIDKVPLGHWLDVLDGIARTSSPTDRE